MLSTKNVVSTQSGSGVKKTLGPGNHVVTINDVSLKPANKNNGYTIVLHVEGPDMGPEFDGFLKDPNNPGGPKFAGQVAKVRTTDYPAADGITKSGIKVFRDQQMLQTLDRLAISTGVQDRLKEIEAKDWDDMISQARRIFFGKKIAICAAGREWTNKGGYTEYDLFLPKGKNGKYAHTAADNTANLLTFDTAEHIVKEKEAKTVESFEPAKADDDFNLF